MNYSNIIAKVSTIKANVVEYIKEHVFNYTLSFRVYYPEHEPRSYSPLYYATRKHLIDDEHTGCMVCGTHDQLEIHHWYIEYAYANAVDWDKMKILHPDFDWSAFKEPLDFVDSEYNCKVLCMKHHRRKNYGIHMLPYPIWIEQMHKPEGFKFAIKKL